MLSPGTRTLGVRDGVGFGARSSADPLGLVPTSSRIQLLAISEREVDQAAGADEAGLGQCFAPPSRLACLAPI